MRTKIIEKKSKTKSDRRIIFRVPDDMLQDFNDLRRVGYGDTEIVVEALKMALADVKAELLKKRAEDASNLYKSSLRTKIPKELQTQSGAQNPVELSAHPANSQQKK